MTTSFLRGAMLALVTATSALAITPAYAAADASAVVKHFVEVGHAKYEDALKTAEALDKAVDALIATPSEATLKAAEKRAADAGEALAGALGGKGGDALALKTTSQRHIAGAATNPLEAALKYRNEEQGAVDGNTVNMDVERSAFAENSVQYQASVTFINGMLTTMQRAIQNQ